VKTWIYIVAGLTGLVIGGRDVPAATMFTVQKKRLDRWEAALLLALYLV